RAPGIESVVRQNQRTPAGQRRHGADYITEAVREGHSETNAVALRVAKHACTQESVVNQVSMRQQDALRRTGSARGVLDVSDVVDFDVCRSRPWVFGH